MVGRWTCGNEFLCSNLMVCCSIQTNILHDTRVPCGSSWLGHMAPFHWSMHKHHNQSNFTTYQRTEGWHLATCDRVVPCTITLVTAVRNPSQLLCSNFSYFTKQSTHDNLSIRCWIEVKTNVVGFRTTSASIWCWFQQVLGTFIF